MKTSKTLQQTCQLLRDRVLFKNASFKLPGHGMGNEPDTKIIKESTRLYTYTWIVPLLTAIEQGDTKRLQELIR